MVKINFDVKKHKLENGLEVITIKKDTQISSINIGVKVGALNGTLSEKGISQNLLYAAEATEYNVESWIRYEN